LDGYSGLVQSQKQTQNLKSQQETSKNNQKPGFDPQKGSKAK